MGRFQKIVHFLLDMPGLAYLIVVRYPCGDVREAVTQIHLEFGRENWFVKMWEKRCAGDTEVRLVSAYSLARRQCFPHNFPIHASLLELTSSQAAALGNGC